MGLAGLKKRAILLTVFAFRSMESSRPEVRTATGPSGGVMEVLLLTGELALSWMEMERVVVVLEMTRMSCW